MKARLADNQSMQGEATNFATCFDNNSSVVAYSHNEKDVTGPNDSDEMEFSMRRPQGFMTAYKEKKITL